MPSSCGAANRLRQRDSSGPLAELYAVYAGACWPSTGCQDRLQDDRGNRGEQCLADLMAAAHGRERRATCACVGLSAAGWGCGLGLLLFAALSARWGGVSRSRAAARPSRRGVTVRATKMTYGVVRPSGTPPFTRGPHPADSRRLHRTPPPASLVLSRLSASLSPGRFSQFSGS